MQAQNQKQFVEYFRSLPQKPATTIRVFNRKEYYTVHGEDAIFISKELFKSTSVIKTIGSDDVTCESLAVNKSQFSALVRDLLLVKQYRVEVFVNKGSKTSPNWQIEYRGSPGNLSQFEDILYSNSESTEGTVVAAVKLGGESKTKTVGVAMVDMNELKFIIDEFNDSDTLPALESVLVQTGPKECLIMGLPSGSNNKLDTSFSSENNSNNSNLTKMLARCNILTTPRKKKDFDSDSLVQDLNRLIKFSDGQQANINTLPEMSKKLAISALGALIKYLELMSDSDTFGKFGLELLDSRRFVHLDAAAMIALNVLPPPGQSGVIKSGPAHSLFALLDKCRTGHGHRLLSQWIKQPVKDINIINERLDLVETLVNDTLLRQELHTEHLKRIPDLQVLAKKLLRNKGNLQDCYRIYQGVKNIRKLVKILENGHSTLTSVIVSPLNELLIDMEKFEEMVDATLDMSLVDKGEFLVKPEFDQELQEMRDKMENLEELFENELKRVGRDIGLEVNKALKLDSNSQYGTFLRVSLKDEKVIRNNKDYEQLDANKAGVRFRSRKLTSLNEDHVTLKEQYESHQDGIVQQVMSVAVGYVDSVNQMSSTLAILDVITSFAVTAISAPEPYIRPIMTPMGSGGLKLIQCRHPLLETLDSVSFIPNDVCFDKDKCTFILVTGPNMGGKSTYMRSIGCSSLLAHIGSFVPCQEATVPIMDCILSRVGASDSQIKGMSTFMVEMVETNSIIKMATENSLVIIDELGRGTSTYDGCGIAWAIAEHLAVKTKAMCLFATHFHELMSLADMIPTLKNVHTRAVIKDEQLTLLYKVADGGSDQSFGIQVAMMADFPQDVIEDAKRKLSEMEDYHGDLKCDGAKKRKILEESDEIIAKFIESCKALPLTSLSNEDALKQVNELKEKCLLSGNEYVKLLINKSCS